MTPQQRNADKTYPEEREEQKKTVVIYMLKLLLE